MHLVTALLSLCLCTACPFAPNAKCLESDLPTAIDTVSTYLYKHAPLHADHCDIQTVSICLDKRATLHADDCIPLDVHTVYVDWGICTTAIIGYVCRCKHERSAHDNHSKTCFSCSPPDNSRFLPIAQHHVEQCTCCTDNACQCMQDKMYGH